MTTERLQVEVRPPNWLPVPGAVKGRASTAADVDDLFSKGTVVSFLPHLGIGRLENKRGDILPFKMSEVVLLGRGRGDRPMKSGDRIGFDASRTSEGLRVTKIRVY